MWRTIRILTYSLLLICPACHHGRMFRSRFTMNVRCPACGIVFERSAGEFSGGMAINTVVTSTIAVIGAALAFFTDIPVWPLIAAMIAVSTLFAIWFYRHARALWTGILFVTGSIREE